MLPAVSCPKIRGGGTVPNLIFLMSVGHTPHTATFTSSSFGPMRGTGAVSSRKSPGPRYTAARMFAGILSISRRVYSEASLTSLHFCPGRFEDFALARGQALNAVCGDFIEDRIDFTADEFAGWNILRLALMPWPSFWKVNFDEFAGAGPGAATDEQLFGERTPTQIGKSPEHAAEMRR